MRFLTKVSDIKFHENLSFGAKLIHADRQMDGLTRRKEQALFARVPTHLKISNNLAPNGMQTHGLRVESYKKTNTLHLAANLVNKTRDYYFWSWTRSTQRKE